VIHPINSPDRESHPFANRRYYRSIWNLSRFQDTLQGEKESERKRQTSLVKREVSRQILGTSIFNETSTVRTNYRVRSCTCGLQVTSMYTHIHTDTYRETHMRACTYTAYVLARIYTCIHKCTSNTRNNKDEYAMSKRGFCSFSFFVFFSFFFPFFLPFFFYFFFVSN